MLADKRSLCDQGTLGAQLNKSEHLPLERYPEKLLLNVATKGVQDQPEFERVNDGAYPGCCGKSKVISCPTGFELPVKTWARKTGYVD